MDVAVTTPTEFCEGHRVYKGSGTGKPRYEHRGPGHGHGVGTRVLLLSSLPRSYVFLSEADAGMMRRFSF